MPQKSLIVLILAISHLGLILGCHHAALSPHIDPTREISAPNTTLEEEQEDYRDTKAGLFPKPHAVKPEAKIPLTCVSDIDQTHSDCRLMPGQNDVAECSKVRIHFACLSYRNQQKTVQQSPN